MAIYMHTWLQYFIILNAQIISFRLQVRWEPLSNYYTQAHVGSNATWSLTDTHERQQRTRDELFAATAKQRMKAFTKANGDETFEDTDDVWNCWAHVTEVPLNIPGFMATIS